MQTRILHPAEGLTPFDGLPIHSNADGEFIFVAAMPIRTLDFSRFYTIFLGIKYEDEYVNLSCLS